MAWPIRFSYSGVYDINGRVGVEYSKNKLTFLTTVSCHTSTVACRVSCIIKRVRVGRAPCESRYSTVVRLIRTVATGVRARAWTVYLCICHDSFFFSFLPNERLHLLVDILVTSRSHHRPAPAPFRRPRTESSAHDAVKRGT